MEARGLCVEHAPPNRPAVPLLQRVDLALFPGELHALVGESGSGKTLAALALMDLLPPGLRVSGGAVFLHGAPRPASPTAWRGRGIGMVFQDPLSALHPLLPVGDQLVDVLVTHHTISRAQARQRALDLLSSVGIAQPQARARLLPHALSGGMRQRVMLALALCGGPRVLLADEPTTALDPLVASGVLALLDAQVAQQQLAVLLITHDLVLAAQHARTVAVMHAGSVVEQGPQHAVLRDAAHPYTRSLVRSRPHALKDPALVLLAEAPPVRPGAWPPGCRYAPRCAHATTECRQTVPTLTPLDSGGSHQVACFHPQRGGLP